MCAGLVVLGVAANHAGSAQAAAHPRSPQVNAVACRQWATALIQADLGELVRGLPGAGSAQAALADRALAGSPATAARVTDVESAVLPGADRAVLSDPLRRVRPVLTHVAPLIDHLCGA